MPRFARLTPDHLALIEGEVPKAVRLFLYALLHSKPATSLQGWSAARVEEWLTASGRLGMELGGFRAVDFTEGQAMQWLGIKSKRAVGEAVAQCIEEGYLLRVATGVKGHPTLYLVEPIPSVECSPSSTNKLGEKQEHDAPPASAIAPPDGKQCAPAFPNNLGDTYKSLHKPLAEAQAASADDAAPPVRKGDACPYCSELATSSHVVGIESIVENPKAELRGELRCPTCLTSWDRHGRFKRFSDQRGHRLRQLFNSEGQRLPREDCAAVGVLQRRETQRETPGQSLRKTNG